MSSKIANAKQGNSQTHNTRGALRVIDNNARANQLTPTVAEKPFVHRKPKSKNENNVRAGLIAKLEAIKHFKTSSIHDDDSSSDDFSDEDFQQIKMKFADFEEMDNIRIPTIEDMDEIYVRNTQAAKETTQREFLMARIENDPSFGRVQ
ncbi:hypothetical protein TRFO_08603 [Tritrichomonas foetus]|uniref:Uncharacterized protein n=1 Tax=Tritrichomonas foetus TaxID=1144522 RepID=A0A1J4JIS2_9EUKA|nr:hypothetical protein TRFO_08603 [Tritrichomonas foetus]|eukprot:OHS99046.1 hypothetical protein TRFO_08603 [Tritrichomonas foetus]